MALEYIDLGAFKRARAAHEPFVHFTGAGALKANQTDALERDFPKLRHAGYLTLGEAKAVGTFAEFLAELQGDEVASVVSELLAFDLRPRPRLVTIMRKCPKRAGRIHTDSKSKRATVLIYFNRAWPAGEAGAVRVLRNEHDFQSTVVEVPPLMGSFLGFLRADNSWHGHLPFEGERKAVQITWLESAADVERKKRTNALAQALKGLWPRSENAA
ncbi:MAG: 2OG-Fe(II) oxygenase [Proteobacteria bacterium]|nr:2OG-Fe(II) oxygenase [Pseudomonadota bacterium]